MYWYTVGSALVLCHITLARWCTWTRSSCNKCTVTGRQPLKHAWVYICWLFFFKLHCIDVHFFYRRCQMLYLFISLTLNCSALWHVKTCWAAFKSNIFHFHPVHINTVHWCELCRLETMDFSFSLWWACIKQYTPMEENFFRGSLFF